MRKSNKQKHLNRLEEFSFISIPSPSQFVNYEITELYSDWVESIWNYHPTKKKKETLRDAFIMGMGLAGETGEVIEILKKKVRDKRKFDKQHLTEELGDVLYYLIKVANSNKITLKDIIITNYHKLEERGKKKRLTKRK